VPRISTSCTSTLTSFIFRCFAESLRQCEERNRRRRSRAVPDGLGNRKDDLVNKIIEEKGVEPYQGSVELIYQLRPAAVAGCRLAQAESSSLACASSYFGSMTRVIDFGNWPGACLSMGHERPQMTAEGASARQCPTGLNRHFRRFVSGLGKTRFPGKRRLGSQRLNSSVALARIIPVSAEIRWQACLAAYRMSLAARPALMLATLIQINAAP
jgi:hypothetical protein